MNTTSLLRLTATLVVASCGEYPPDGFNAAEIERLPDTTTSVRVRGLGDDDVPSLVRLTHVQQLRFSDGWGVLPSRITDCGLEALAAVKLPELRSLDLGYCDHITDAGLAHVCKMRQVTDLQLSVCCGVTDAGLVHVGKMTWLTRLDLRGCEQITDSGLDALTPLTRLGELMLGGCDQVTPQGVARLQSALPNANVAKDEREWSFHRTETQSRPR